MSQVRSGYPRETILVSLILAGALVVRLLGVHRGLPYIQEWDEPFIMRPVIQMFLFKSLNPAFFSYPSLYYYLVLPVVYVHYAYLHTQGVLASSGDIVLFHPQAIGYWWYINYPSFYLWARVLTVLLGTATVYLIYRIGKATFGSAVGLLAAALLAVAPGAVYYADTVRVDIPMAFFATAAVLAGLGVLQQGRLRDYVVAGFLAGLAMSTKQTAFWVVVPLGIAHLLNARRERLIDRNLEIMFLCVVAGFFAGTPYALLESNLVFTWFRHQAREYGGLPTLGSIVSGLPRNLAYFVRPSQGGEWYPVPHTALGLLPAIAAAWGLIAGFLWKPRLQLYLAGFALPMFLFVSGLHAFYLRNLMAVLPFAALWAAVACVWLWRQFEVSRPAWRTAWRLGLGGLGLALLLLGPVRESFALTWALGRHQDTRTEAVQWLLQHAPPGARVGFELELRWFLPALDRLPFRVEFAGQSDDLSWYAKQRIEFAVVGDKSPLLPLPAAAVFPRPPYLPTPKQEAKFIPDSYPVIDPKVIIVRLKPP